MLIADDIDDNRQDLLAIGADDFLSKPFREVELLQKIHRHLGVEYVYAEQPEVAPPEKAAELKPDCLADLLSPDGVH